MIRTETILSKNNKVVSGRLLPGTNLIDGILKICEEENIESGVILTAIGSFKEINLVHAIEDESMPSGIDYTPPINLIEPMELLTGQGTIGRNESGELDVHMHGVMVNGEFEVLGGHFLNDKNIVLATVELSILKIEDGNIERSHDDETGFVLFKYKE